MDICGTNNWVKSTKFYTNCFLPGEVRSAKAAVKQLQLQAWLQTHVSMDQISTPSSFPPLVRVK
jgi:hypothetical protein